MVFEGIGEDEGRAVWIGVCVFDCGSEVGDEGDGIVGEGDASVEFSVGIEGPEAGADDAALVDVGGGEGEAKVGEDGLALGAGFGEVGLDWRR